MQLALAALRGQSGVHSVQGSRLSLFFVLFNMVSPPSRYLHLTVLPENVNIRVQLILSSPRSERAGPLGASVCHRPPVICCLPRVLCGQAQQCRHIFCRRTVVNTWRRGSCFLFHMYCPEMSSLVLSMLLLWAFAANHEAGSKMHIGSSPTVQFSKVEASGPDKWESSVGRRSPLAWG